uniref:cathepsin X n=1 Tax=Globodera rostochiensis TaxID=31243 RepID=A0A914IDM3_GLORO
MIRVPFGDFFFLTLLSLVLLSNKSPASCRRLSNLNLLNVVHTRDNKNSEIRELAKGNIGQSEKELKLVEDVEEPGDPVDAFWEWDRMVVGGGGELDFIPERMLRIGPSMVQKVPSAANRPLYSPFVFPNPHTSKHVAFPQKEMPPCLRPMDRPFRAHRTYPRSWEFPGFEASIPRHWDWRNVSGINYSSPNRNQHIPVYCGGCWVFGTLGSLQDRFNVARNNRWPMTQLSPQEIIACNGRGNCNGGTAEDVFVHAKIQGLVEEGCNNYKAVNEKCTPFTRCGSCWPDSCFAIQNYTRYYIKDYGKLSGRIQMMSEIHNRGPIACAISATEQFDKNYTGGIFQQLADSPSNHIVSVSGWGWDEESKTEFWIVRNSWGDAWGEMGWFRIVTSIYRGGRGDQYNLGIERECYFADPDVSNLI